ncbi:MAG: hypothetical protein NTW87_19405, partial [Planctomycetota bacterium]|nr:hypothetical protein [Planctomycetota bacterium]
MQTSYRIVADSVAQGRHMEAAAEWLLDNYYLIEEQIRVARELLPRSYSRELPRLKSGPFRGFPVVYELVLELVTHTDGHVDIEHLSAFTTAYQRVRPLELGELWAVPIMLRLALIENLRRVAYRIAWRRRNRDLGQAWAQRFLTVVQQRPKDLIAVLADLAREDLPLHTPYIAELSSGLRGQSAALGLVLNWLEQELGESG